MERIIDRRVFVRECSQHAAGNETSDHRVLSTPLVQFLVALA
ncbi:MAG: hypothetical protein R3E89_14755 [Thiolinea sp.]